jgi:transposase-like protein
MKTSLDIHERHPVGSPLDDAGWFQDLEQTEERCREYLEDLRWPDGVVCPRCGSDSTGTIPARRRFYCRRCRHHFSATSATIFHGSRLPLWKWFVSISLLLDSKAGLPANQLVQLLGGSYKTAWFVEHRIRAALLDEPPPAGGRPEDDCGRIRLYDRPIVGCYHQLGVKYLPAYEAESSWRTRNRGNPNAFEDTLLALLRADPVSYRELVRSTSVAFA